MKIRYNAPVTLTLALAATLVMALDQTLFPGITASLFAVRGTFSPLQPLDWLRMFSHVLGHANWEHLLSNFAFILLLGPILEEKHGGGRLIFMIGVTALVTGLLNVALLDTGLLGASGIVFMMIMLISFTNIRQGEIPLTFIAVTLLFLAREVIDSLQTDSVSQFAHIVGGIIGSLFGFFRPARG